MNDTQGSGGPVFLNLWHRRELDVYLLEPGGHRCRFEITGDVEYLSPLRPKNRHPPLCPARLPF
jgi:hypothetical protein